MEEEGRERSEDGKSQAEQKELGKGLGVRDGIHNDSFLKAAVSRVRPRRRDARDQPTHARQETSAGFAKTGCVAPLGNL